MIALAIVLLVDATLMEQLVTSLLVLAAAVFASVLILFCDRWWRARHDTRPRR